MYLHKNYASLHLVGDVGDKTNNVVLGSLTLENRTYTDALNDTSSAAFADLEEDICKEVGR